MVGAVGRWRGQRQQAQPPQKRPSSVSLAQLVCSRKLHSCALQLQRLQAQTVLTWHRDDVDANALEVLSHKEGGLGGLGFGLAPQHGHRLCADGNLHKDVGRGEDGGRSEGVTADVTCSCSGAAVGAAAEADAQATQHPHTLSASSRLLMMFLEGIAQQVRRTRRAFGGLAMKPAVVWVKARMWQPPCVVGHYQGARQLPETPPLALKA